VRLNFSDRIGTTALELTTSYSPGGDLQSSERLHLRAVLRHWNWKLSAALNRGDFYDLFGPTTTSRKGYALSLQYSGNLFRDGPRHLGWTAQVAAYGGLRTVPEYQNVSASFTRLQSFSTDLEYESLRRSLGAIEDEMGTTWGATVRGNYVNGTLYPRLNIDAARGFLLPLDHSSLWFRASAATALTDRKTEPFAQFFFGGFGNNWVDHQAVKRFRDTESFPGIDINRAGGANYARAQVEWTLPPMRFRRVGIPSAYLRWAALSLFGTGLMTNVDVDSTRSTLASVGAQLDVRLITLSHLESTFSVGYAIAARRGGRPESATMFSFKIM